MNGSVAPSHHVAIACGGTGGHLFPGLAVAHELRRRACAVTLLVSPKDVDQRAVRAAVDVAVATLPAVGLTRGSRFAFLRGFIRSYLAARDLFTTQPPNLALAMGGFTSAPPILAARKAGARTFLHESNTIPGRANRWLSWLVTRAFVGFPEAAECLHGRQVAVTGTPVRPQFRPRDAAACRAAVGLAPDRPVLLVTGGSQGAAAINALMLESLPLLARRLPHWQYLHLSGLQDAKRLEAAYAGARLPAVVHPFFDQMELALGAATVALSRAGASSLAELAAVRVPCVLIPYPAATDNHQLHNARALEATGAARVLRQHEGTPESLLALFVGLGENAAARAEAQAALARWHVPDAARRIAEAMLEAIPDHTKIAVANVRNASAGRVSDIAFLRFKPVLESSR